MSKKQKVVGQHIVPATYLRKFCSDDNGKNILYAFNKSNNKIICTIPEKIGKLNEFYETIQEEQILEEVLSSFEAKYNLLFDKIKSGIKNLNFEDKELIAKFVALQFLRTEDMKNGWTEISNAFLKIKDQMAPSLRKEVEEFSKMENIRTGNKEFILKNFEEFAKIILNRKWILLLNETKMSYWTSDNPVCLYSPRKFGGVGLASPESELYFPLSPDYCLLICDPEKCKDFPFEIKSMEENIDFQRSLQINYSNRFIFSRDNEFNLVEEAIRERPELSKINRSSVKIVNPPDMRNF